MVPKERLPDKDSALYAHLQLQFGLKLLDPENTQSLSDIAWEFNKKYAERRGIYITIKTLLRWKRDPVFVMRKNSLQRRIEDQYAGEINRKLIQKCLEGSGYHMTLWYNRRGELVQKRQEVPADALPTDKKEVDAEIASLIARTNPLEEE